MKTLKTYLLMAGAALMFTARTAYADMANGTYTFNPSSSNALIWDISGHYSGVVFALGFDTDFTINENPDGTFSGTGTFDIEQNNTSLTGDLTVSGKVLGSSAKTGVSMEFDLSGGGVVQVDSAGDTDNADVTFKLKPNFTVDGQNRVLVLSGGSASTTLVDLDTNKKKTGSDKLPKGTTFDIPAGDEGSWGLSITLIPNGTKYTGTASLETAPNGITENFTVTGTYSARTDTSKLTLKGNDGTLSLVISTSGPNMTVQSIKGKVFGQSIKFTNP